MAPLTDLKMVVGFGMAAGVDHRVHESEPPWWYRDVLGAGLSLARRGGDRELMNGMLRSSLEQCQDEIFVAQATRWVQQLVEDLGRADGVDTHRELSHVPPAECELGDWAMHTMDVLIFEYQRKGGTDCGQGEAEVDGLPAPGSVRPRSRSPRRRTTVPPEDIHTVSDVVSLMETGGNGGHREERRHRGGEVAKPRPKTKARVPALRVKPGSCDHRCPGIPQPGQVPRDGERANKGTTSPSTSGAGSSTDRPTTRPADNAGGEEGLANMNEEHAVDAWRFLLGMDPESFEAGVDIVTAGQTATATVCVRR